MKQNITLTRILFVFGLLAAVIFAFVPRSQTQGEIEMEAASTLTTAAPVFSYQGQLSDNQGNPMNGTVNMVFRLFPSASGGTACWTETRSESDGVTVTNGRFHVLLGSITPIEAACANQETLYLELRINNETLAPRQPLTEAWRAATVADGAITPAKLNLNEPVAFNYQPVQQALIWPISYDARGGRNIMPGFYDTLYYANKRNISYSANRAPSSGSLESMFELRRNNSGSAGWTDVSAANPVQITIQYPGAGSYLTGVGLIFGFRNSHAIDYTIEYYQDNNNNGQYEWTTIATVTDNYQYEVYHPYNSWRVQRIRIQVTRAGDSDRAGHLRLATVLAPNPESGRATGHFMDVGGDTMYGTLDMNNHDIEGVKLLKVEGAGDSSMIIGNPSTANMYFDLTAGSAFVFRNLASGGNCPPSQPNCEMMKINSNGSTVIYGNLDLRGTCVLSNTSDGQVTEICTAGNITSGAYIEANLQTPTQRHAEKITRFSQGDLLCWQPEQQQLELCTVANDRLVQAVADPNGKPIILGAEPMKVLGPVTAGDILVASVVPGYAMVNNSPAPGTVIGQALEDFNEESGLIKAMIRKW